MNHFGKNYKRIFLIRHGEKLKDKGNVGLSKKGKKQALLTAEYFKQLNFKIDCIISSPEKRAIETANIIAKKLNLVVKKDHLLKERLNYGEIKNQTYKEYVKLCTISSFNRNYILPNGQSSIIAGKRIEKLIKKLSKTNFKNIILISHGGVIADYLRNIFSENYLKQKNSYFVKKLVVEPCSITTLLLTNDNKIKLLNLDYTHHLV